MTEIMGFHKRWITIEQAISRFDAGGIDALKRYCEAADAIVVTDDYTTVLLKKIETGASDHWLTEYIERTRKEIKSN